MRERLLAAMKSGPEEMRRRAIVAKSVKRAIQGPRTTIIQSRPHCPPSGVRQVRLIQAERLPSTTPIYGDPSADRAYERYFRSITRR